ncbi:MAG: sodium:proton antiporter [bacterium]
MKKFGCSRSPKGVALVFILFIAVVALFLYGPARAQEKAGEPPSKEHRQDHAAGPAHPAASTGEHAEESAHDTGHAGGGHERHVDVKGLKEELDERLKTDAHIELGPEDSGSIVLPYKSKDHLDRMMTVITGDEKPKSLKQIRKQLKEKFALYSKEVKVDDPSEPDSAISIRYTSTLNLEKLVNSITSWKPPLWSVTGFVLMLLSIAIIPLIKPHWWEHNKNRAIVSLILGVPFGTYVVINDYVALLHTLHEYEQFIILLGSLFVISGGIWLSGDVRSTPRNNTIFIAIGSVLASFIGTTGAAMLLIRPLIKTNSERKYKVHTVVFFIFLVANIGGSLTPVGDPPLFLGYLKGVPFTWTLVKLWPYWAATVAWLLALYFVVDTYIYRTREADEAKKWDNENVEPLKLRGAHNFLFLLGVVLSVAFYPYMLSFMTDTLNIPHHTAEYIPVRESIMILMSILGWVTTKSEYREAQNFTWGPILEVAILFAAIFVTMVPALTLLRNWGPTSPIQEPWHFFWITGSLSSFLDNAPTYLVFLSLGEGQGAPPGMASVVLNSGGQIKEVTLVAISVGAVFMGANTYIGNAPNFMVKSISEENKVAMPSFFGYMLWSIGILVIPTFIILTLIAFV